jgi:hypothetical protein
VAERLFTLSLCLFRNFRMNKMAEVAWECAEKEHNWKRELYTAQKHVPYAISDRCWYQIINMAADRLQKDKFLSSPLSSTGLTSQSWKSVTLVLTTAEVRSDIPVFYSLRPSYKLTSLSASLWSRSSSKCYLRIQSVPQRKHHTSPLQRSNY